MAAVLGAMLLETTTVVTAEPPFNILFLGNSLTQNSDILSTISAIATTAGRPAPVIKR